MTKRIAALALLALPALWSCRSGVSVEEAVASISEADHLSKISIIAHDSMLGRANLTPELVATAEWIAAEFERYGLEPGGNDGTYLQHYTIRRLKPDFEASSAQVSGGGTLEFGKDLNIGRGSRAGTFSGGVVLVAGTPAEGQTLDLAPVRGKHVIVLPAPPPPAGQPARRRMRMPPGLAEAEPASLITVDRNPDSVWNAAVARTREQPQTVTPWASGTGMASFTIRESSLTALLAPLGIQVARLAAQAARAGAGVVVTEVPGLEISLTTAMQEMDSFDQPNAVGILEGSDKRLRNEYVVYSAHMDHVAPGRPNEAGDSIRNGADDDGSGTIAVVELAEAFAMLKHRPERSVIFLAVSGEESGLWGSRYFAENPPVPLEQIVANLNADMISRNATDSIVVIGKEHSDLGATMDHVSQAHPELNLVASDDIWPEENFYSRSDHYNFARRGVPILFFFCGTTEDYHGVDDEVEKMDISKATRVTQLMFHLGLEVGNAPARPQWNPESYAEIVEGAGGAGR
jgi:hypothetical protein